MANIEYKKRRLSREQIAQLSANQMESIAVPKPGTLSLRQTGRKVKARVDRVPVQKPQSPFANLRNMLATALT